MFLSLLRARNAHEKIIKSPHTNLISFVVNGMLTDSLPGFNGEIIVTEGLGPSLRNVMRRARLDTNRAYYPSFCTDNIKRIGSQIAKAMAHLETLKIFHLDLKAGNVVFVKPDIRYTIEHDDIQPTIQMETLVSRLSILDAQRATGSIGRIRSGAECNLLPYGRQK
ncbi:hypothetical protein B9Z55_029038 [Caenorhabditis nigoni]|uniref:Protein kinase domain-containing protein n=1 Tax=Caenorhabditis nigoni TaxID=1611254 RepID=A0A2G5S8V7_9PELO|nr:hypothetical protein B9Z55_029038 [Caenorhabditis nigoni]